jgi:predicted O-methyltransferase YrrM
MLGQEGLPPGVDIPERLWRAILHVELVANEWVIPDKPRDHSFGRLPEETEIRAWSVPRTTGYFLRSLCRLLQPRTVLEIGTSLAYSTLWLSTGVPIGSKVHTIEILPEKILLAVEHIALAGATNIQIHRGDAVNITESWSDPIDLLFLDADPENYVCYMKHLDHVMAPGSVVVMDNAVDHIQQTELFIERLQAQKRWRSWIHPVDHGLFIAVAGGQKL